LREVILLSVSLGSLNRQDLDYMINQRLSKLINWLVIVSALLGIQPISLKHTDLLIQYALEFWIVNETLALLAISG
jgi:hypothetical protein